MCNVARCVEEISKKERRTVVVKNRPFCGKLRILNIFIFAADYVINQLIDLIELRV